MVSPAGSWALALSAELVFGAETEAIFRAATGVTGCLGFATRYEERGSRADLDVCAYIERLNHDLLVSCALADVILLCCGLSIARKNVESPIFIGALPR